MDSPLPLPDGSLQALFAWLETRGGVAGALLVATLWLWTLLRERTAYRLRNDALSDALVNAIESGSAERSRMADEYRLGHDWTVRSLLDHFRALAESRMGGGQSIGGPQLSTLKPPPPKPASPAASDSPRSMTPPPNPPTTPPTTPKRPTR